MILYHLEKTKFKDVWPPQGTLFSDGRWNKAGQWIIYCSPSIALAKLEILANENRLVNDRICMTIEVDEEAEIYSIKKDSLPNDWMNKPYPTFLSQETKRFLASDQLLCEVPSAQSYRENNFLINVRHPSFYKLVKLIDVRPEPFDERLIAK
ncbi:MAG: RES domain-containing protein [Cyclobacteriaceae bacterium]